MAPHTNIFEKRMISKNQSPSRRKHQSSLWVDPKVDHSDVEVIEIDDDEPPPRIAALSPSRGRRNDVFEIDADSSGADDDPPRVALCVQSASRALHDDEGSNKECSVQNDVIIEPRNVGAVVGVKTALLSTEDEPFNQFSLSDLLSKEACGLLAKHKIYTPSQLLGATNITGEVRDIACQFKAWQTNRRGMEALLRMKQRRTSATSIENEPPYQNETSERNHIDDSSQHPPPPHKSWAFVDLTCLDSDSELPGEKKASPPLGGTDMVEKLQPRIVTNDSFLESAAKPSTTVARGGIPIDDDFDSSDDDLSLPPRRRRLFTSSVVRDDRKMSSVKPSIDVSHSLDSSMSENENESILDTKPSATKPAHLSLGRGSNKECSVQNDVIIEPINAGAAVGVKTAPLSTKDEPLNQLLLSDILSKEACDLLAKHKIYTPSQLLAATNTTGEVRDIACRFKAWQTNRTGMEALLRMKQRRTSETSTDKMTNTRGGAHQPAELQSSTTNDSALHRAPVSDTGGVMRVKKPKKKNKDGLYTRPAGRAPKGKEWDTHLGIWKESKTPNGSTILLDGRNSSGESSHDKTAMETEMVSGRIKPSEVRENDVLFGREFFNSKGNRSFREFIKAYVSRGNRKQEAQAIRVFWQQKKSGRFLLPAKTDASGAVLEFEQAPISDITRKISRDLYNRLYHSRDRQNDPELQSPDSALSRGDATIPTVVSSAQQTPLSSMPVVRREGPWTVEEKQFAERVIREYRSGFLNVPLGTNLKEYLAEILQRDPAQIAKRYEADLLMSRRTFSPVPRDPSNAASFEKTQAELEVLEQNWRRGLEQSGSSGAMTAIVSACEPSISKQGIKRDMEDVGTSSRRKRDFRVSYKEPGDLEMPDSEFLSPYSRPEHSNVSKTPPLSSMPVVRREGAWTVEEKQFAERVIREYRSGFLNAPLGTNLKEYLAEKLQRDPAQIATRFEADLLMSRRTFSPAPRDPSNTALIDKSQAELEVLEQNWRRGLERSGNSGAMTAIVSACEPSISKQGIKRDMEDVGTSTRRKRNFRVSYKEPGSPDSDFGIPYSRTEHSNVSETPTDVESSTVSDEEMLVMNEISHLTRTAIDPSTGYPVTRISVFSDPDETIYDFKVQVRKSGIPNGGLGAFLTFLGARVLKAECRKRNNEKLSNREYWVPETMNPLEAVAPAGHGVSVKLTGSNLHGNQNSRYRPISTFTLTAAMPEGGEVGVKLSGTSLHYDSDDEEPLNLSIGYLGIHTESDYVPLDSKTFSNRLGLVDLGRYGPILKNDRKPKLIFDMKNFLFDYEPACWSFGVEERLRGCEQIIDITDDATGEPHECASNLIPMYVNEVGHSKTYEQNVLSLDPDGRSVHYYLNVENALKKGETVELFVDYFDHYEQIRERKGYGLANLEKGVRGDEHQASLLERNFAEREEMEDCFKNLTLMELFELVEFIHTKILGPVVDATGAFIAHRFSEAQRSADTSSFGEGEGGRDPPLVPSCLQWIARRRMHWASERLENRAQELMAELEDMGKLDVAGLSAASTFPYEGMLLEVQKWLTAMKWDPAGEVMKHLHGVRDASGKSVRDAIVFDMSEEVLHTLSKVLIKPLDEALWCPIASELTKSLCEDCVCNPPWLTNDQKVGKQHLAGLFFARARSAAAAVRDACRMNGVHNAPQLHFGSGGEDDFMVNGSDLEGFLKLNRLSPLSIDNSTIPKGVTAALADIQAYRDALELGHLEETFDEKQLQLPASGSFVIAKHGCSLPLKDSPSNSSRETVGIPRKHDVFVNGASVDETWYLLWQVVYVVHTFASMFLMPGSHVRATPETDMPYSLQRVCQEVGVDFSDAQRMIESGIPTGFRLPEPSAKRRKGKRSSARGGAKHSRPRLSGSHKYKRFLFNEIVWKALEGEGWTVTYGHRPTDYYWLPPGVVRGKGFSPRVDFFDSIPLVMKFIQSDARWKDKPAVIQCLKLHSACEKLIGELKSARKMPKGELKLEWLVSQLTADGPELKVSS